MMKRPTSLALSASLVLALGSLTLGSYALAQAPAAAAADRARGAWRSACRVDLVRLCRGAKGTQVRGGPAKRQCLEANLTKLEPACQTALNERKQQRAETLLACQEDVKTLCKDAPTGRSARIQCLREKASSASPGCAKALTTLAGRSGAPALPAPKN